VAASRLASFFDVPSPEIDKHPTLQFYRGLKGAKGSRLYALQCTSIKGKSSDFVRILTDLGQEQQFEVTYVDVDERSDSDEVQCLVQLSTLPVAVCYGVGEDLISANNDAARNALNYLKMMTKSKAETSSTSSNTANGGDKSAVTSVEDDDKKEEGEKEGGKKEDKTAKTSKKNKEQQNGK
jgi:hypothetical protein